PLSTTTASRTPSWTGPPNATPIATLNSSPFSAKNSRPNQSSGTSSSSTKRTKSRAIQPTTNNSHSFHSSHFPMKEIIIDFTPDGSAKIEAIGFQGSSCEATTKALEQALGV